MNRLVSENLPGPTPRSTPPLGFRPIPLVCDGADWRLGVLLPDELYEQLAVTVDRHYRRNARVERQIMLVVQKRDGTSETLTPADFKQKYGFKNDPRRSG